MSLTDAQFERFQLLTQRTFLALDTEFCHDEDGLERLISIAVVPVIRGKRSSDGQLYKEMNPGVSISPESTAVHGFTDATVARKRRFGFYAADILAALDVPGAVLVEHTGCDVRVLRNELERLDAARAAGDAAIKLGLADLPELPIIDTSTLPRLLRLPGAMGSRGIVSLATLGQLTGVSNKQPHHARGDAVAAAESLIELLLHVARTGTHDTLEQLLADHDRGTTRAPRVWGGGTGPRDSPVSLPAAHLVRHDNPLTHEGSAVERAAWVELAKECAQLRCEYLRGEAALAAANNGRALFDPLFALLGGLTEPGGPGTLLGALAELIEPADTAGVPALAHTRALRWWEKARPAVAGSTPCGDRNVEACPQCRAGEGCPRDTMFHGVARIATLGERGVLDHKSIKDRLFGDRPDRRIQQWLPRHADAAAFMAWMAVVFTDDDGRPKAALDLLEQAKAKDLHLVEPRLALLACTVLLDEGRLDEVERVTTAVLAHRTTDPAYRELAAWLDWHQQSQVLAARRRAVRTITHPRLARPAGRTNPNPYLPS